MKISSNKDIIQLGRKIGGEVLKAIANAKKSVKIVSPYLTPSYLEQLVKLKSKGVKITLITSDDLEEGGHFSMFKHSDVIKQDRIIDLQAELKRKRGFSKSLIIFLASLVFFTLSFLNLFLLIPTLLLAALSARMTINYYFLKIYKYEYFPLFRIKVFDSKSAKHTKSMSLIHAKVFLIDDHILFLGSANFTYSAFHTHYETIIKVEDPRAIRAIAKEIEALFNSTDLHSKSIDEWGKAIYE